MKLLIVLLVLAGIYLIFKPGLDFDFQNRALFLWYNQSGFRKYKVIMRW